MDPDLRFIIPISLIGISVINVLFDRVFQPVVKVVRNADLLRRERPACVIVFCYRCCSGGEGFLLGPEPAFFNLIAFTFNFCPVELIRPGLSAVSYAFCHNIIPSLRWKRMDDIIRCRPNIIHSQVI